MNTLWLKTLRDLWLFKGRTLLVVLAIAVGTAAVGVCVTSLIVLRNDLRDGYAATNPAHAILDATPFDDSLAGKVAALPEVAEAEARQMVSARMTLGGEDRQLQLSVIPDFAAVRVGRLAAQPGALVPPPPGTILLERSVAGPLNVAQGDAVMLRTSDGDTFPLQVAGFIHDMGVAPTTVQPWVYGYITDDTAARLGLPETYNQLYLTIGTRDQGPGSRADGSSLAPGPWNLEPALTRADVERGVTAVTDWLESDGVLVQRANIPEPGVHLMQGNVDTGLLMIGILGGLTMLLGAFLVTNVMGAVVAQQVPQIGVLKALGAGRGLVLRQYGRMVVIFGLLALLLAVPLGLLGAWFMSNDLARRLNYDIPSFGLKATTLAVQAAGALLVPALAALGPLRAASRMPIRDALAKTGDTNYESRVQRAPFFASRIAYLVSLRNVARRPVRLALTVAALALAGAMVMATFGLRLGLYEAVEILVGEFPYSVQVDVAEPQPLQRLLRAAGEVAADLDVPMRAEAWGMADARRIYPDGRLGTSFTLYGVPATTQIAPFAEKTGRWLYQEGARDQGPGSSEENPGLAPGTWPLEPALYINYETAKLTEQPGVSDELALRLNGVQERAARLVGISLRPFEPAAYMPYDQWQRATGQRGRASRLVVYLEEDDGRRTTDDGSSSGCGPSSVVCSPVTVATELTARLEAAGVVVARTETAESYRAGYRAQFDTLVLLIMSLAGLTALVGGLGLGNTMALNVLERSREIGVLRALGARRPLLRRLVLVEGLLIALASAALAVPLAVPLTLALDRIMGNALLGSPLTFAFSWPAAVAWLALVIAIALVACWLPADRAARMTIREAVSYDG